MSLEKIWSLVSSLGYRQQWSLGSQVIVTKWCQRCKLSLIQQEHISLMQKARKASFTHVISLSIWKKQTKWAYLTMQKNIRRLIWTQLNKNLQILRHVSLKWYSSLKSIQVSSYTCWGIMVRKTRFKSIWPSAKLLRTIEINTASISMAICWHGSNRKERQED